jgi:hypothetical protein
MQFIEPTQIERLEKSFGPNYYTIVDTIMTNNAMKLRSRQAIKHGRSLAQDIKEGRPGYYTPLGYLYGDKPHTHWFRAFEDELNSEIEMDIERLKAEDIMNNMDYLCSLSQSQIQKLLDFTIY